MRVIGMFLLMIVLLPLSYGEYIHHARSVDEAGQAVCVTNIRMACQGAPETYQAMVLVRGQLLALPSSSHD